MPSYSITTNKSWHATNQDLEETMIKWGVREWETNYPKGARSTSSYQSEEDRTVTLTYKKEGKTVSLSMDRQSRAVDNLRVLYLAVESMRLNEKRGIGDVVKEAYLQLAAPKTDRPAYEILGIMPDSPLMVAEAAYKHKAKTAHPDAGGSAEAMTELNKAIEYFRNKS